MLKLIILGILLNYCIISEAQNHTKQDSTYFNCYNNSFIENFTQYEVINTMSIGNICDSKYDIEIRVNYFDNLWAMGNWKLFVLKYSNSQWYLDYYQRRYKKGIYFLSTLQLKQDKNTIRIDSIYNELILNNILTLNDTYKLLDSLGEMRPGDHSYQNLIIGIKNNETFKNVDFCNAEMYNNEFKNIPTFLYCRNIGKIFEDLRKYIYKQPKWKN